MHRIYLDIQDASVTLPATLHAVLNTNLITYTTIYLARNANKTGVVLNIEDGVDLQSNPASGVRGALILAHETSSEATINMFGGNLVLANPHENSGRPDLLMRRGKATFNMYGGTLDVEGDLVLGDGTSAKATFNLFDGEVRVHGALSRSSTAISRFDVHEGTLMIEGKDWTTNAWEWIDSKRLTSSVAGKYVVAEYDPVENRTVVYAVKENELDSLPLRSMMHDGYFTLLWEAQEGWTSTVLTSTNLITDEFHVLAEGLDVGSFTVALEDAHRFFSVLQTDSDAQEPIAIGAVSEGGLYHPPVLPELMIGEKYGMKSLIVNGSAYVLNGQLYRGEMPVSIHRQGFYHFSVTVTNEWGGGFTESVRFFVIDPAEPAPIYPIPAFRARLDWIADHPHVTPTASGSDQFVLGQSSGWADRPRIPPQDIYGFMVADPDAHSERPQVVLVGGNHPPELVACWALHGAVEFLLSDDERAEELRRRYRFFVYPMVNPDGRFEFEFTGRRSQSNPEMRAAGQNNHNRAWDTSGVFSTIDVMTGAMKADTGGGAEYLLDFHSNPGLFFYTSRELMDHEYSKAMTVRGVPAIVGSTRTELLRYWAVSEHGLNASFACAPEFPSSMNADRAMGWGREYVLAFHDILSEPDDAQSD